MKAATPDQESQPPVSHRTVTTTDVDRAHAFLVDLYGDHRSRLLGSDRRFVLDVAAVDVGTTVGVTDTFGLDRVYRGSDVASTYRPPEGLLVVGQVVAGRLQLEDGVDTTGIRPGGLSLLSHERQYRSRSLDLAVRVVRLDLAVVARVAAETTGIPPEVVRFHGTRPVSDRMAGHWSSTLRDVAQGVLLDEELLRHPLVRAQTIRSVAMATLAVFPNTAQDAATDPTRAAPGPVGPAPVRRAIAFVDAHAHEPITLTDIAGAAHVGPRALQLAFRRHRDQTPLEYLREVRLHRVRTDLRDGDPTQGDTVARIASRWGFTHRGRFSVAYRQAYGESPARTLDR